MWRSSDGRKGAGSTADLTIIGLDGNDVLTGGGGADDFCHGGSGADVAATYPVFSVDTEEEALQLLVLTCYTNLRGQFIARVPWRIWI